MIEPLSIESLSLFIETIPALVWCAAPSGDVTYMNRRMLDYTGTTFGGWVPLTWGDFLHADEAAEAEGAWRRAVAAGEPFESQCRLRRHDGVYRWFQMLGEAAFDADGKVTRWYVLLVDVDYRKSIEEALRSMEMKLSRATRTATVGELAASIAHEINQPLTAVVANAYASLRWLAAEPPAIAKAIEATERIVRDGKGAAEVVQRIRSLFKQAPPQKIDLDLNEVLREVLRLLNGEAARKRVTVETALDQALAPVCGDRVQLQQLAFNLVLNAIEAMDQVVDRHRRLVVRSKGRAPDSVLVEIQDCGVGMQDSEKVFEAFFTTKENGLGMGLAVCRSIIEAHQGRLWATSGESAGTTFFFTLPAVSPAGAQ